MLLLNERVNEKTSSIFYQETSQPSIGRNSKNTNAYRARYVQSSLWTEARRSQAPAARHLALGLTLFMPLPILWMYVSRIGYLQHSGLSPERMRNRTGRSASPGHPFCDSSPRASSRGLFAWPLASSPSPQSSSSASVWKREAVSRGPCALA